ncbi:hypothetical protein K438DRAFT_1981940 [Mycena galopus ATCC 62051]|nr:hypothetical protein K438DRAFT_1981940 [Mycena galopus ATCC 62051]
MAQSQVKRIAGVFRHENVTTSDFVLTLLERNSLQNHPCTTSLTANAERIIQAFSQNLHSAPSSYAWARQTIQKKTVESIKVLTANDDWHFNAGNASVADLEDFKIEEMAAGMKKLAPDLWHLLNLLLSKDYQDLDGDQLMDDVGDVDEFDESGKFASRAPNAGKEAKEKRRDAIKTIKTTVMISIMMQSRNSKANALESIFGIFLHSTNTPEKVIQALAHMGISISPTAIHRAIHSLSAETADTLREMGQTLLSLSPKIEQAADPLTHLTFRALICLEHGVVLADLECSEVLWSKSGLNPNQLGPSTIPTPNIDMLYPEKDDPSGMTRRERWNARKFKADLYEHSGHTEFSTRTLNPPESVEQIPVVQMRYAPARSMDINQSTHAGNISAIENLPSQGGVGPPPPSLDPKEKDPAKIAQHKRLRQLVSIAKYVVLFFGDLGTYERVQGVLLRRSIEATPWRRHQFMVFVMGFFHLKTAADAIKYTAQSCNYDAPVLSLPK